MTISVSGYFVESSFARVPTPAALVVCVVKERPQPAIWGRGLISCIYLTSAPDKR